MQSFCTSPVDYLSIFVNTTVPGGVVGDAFRAVRTRGLAGLERAAQSVVIERLAGQIALGGTLIFGLALSGRPELQLFSATAVIVLVVLGTSFHFGKLSIPQRVTPRVLQRFASATKESWLDARAASLQVGLSILIVVANLAAFDFAARATGTVLPFPELLFAIPLILIAMLIPLSVAGWGYREGAAAVVFPMIGATAAEGVSASILFGAVVLVASLPGGAVLLLRKSGTEMRQGTREQPDHGGAK